MTIMHKMKLISELIFASLSHSVSSLKIHNTRILIKCSARRGRNTSEGNFGRIQLHSNSIVFSVLLALAGTGRICAQHCATSF